ncbi:FecCD family ABC transporter permease [Amedibacillus sp. YH-ame10]
MGMIKQHPRLFLLGLFLILGLCFFVSINVGSIKVSPVDLLKGLFIEYNKDVASIYNIRFPRVFVSMLTGAALALSGLYLQVVLKNPLADPSIIGISSGASLVSSLIILWLPQLYFFTPVFAFVGGLTTFAIIYSLSWKSGLQVTRILLIGVALNYTLSAISQFVVSSSSTISSQGSGQMTFMTWKDVSPLAIYLIPLLILSLFLFKACDLMGLEDKTLLSLGINVNVYRLLLSSLAVFLCSISVSIAGVISFVGLIVPHIARLFVGNQHRYLLPVTLVLGAILLLCADTLGRVLLAPYEISSAIMMAVLGGPLFIILLKRGMQDD